MSGDNRFARYALTAFGGAAAYQLLDWKYDITADLSFVSKFISLAFASAMHTRRGNTLADIFEETVRQHKNKVFLVMGDDKWTYGRVNELANQVARWLSTTMNFAAGDIAALYMGNRPEYVALWMGVIKAGGVCALLNYNVTGKGLVHSIKISTCKLLITEDELHAPIVAIRVQLPGLKIFAMGNGSTPLPRFDVSVYDGKKNVSRSLRQSRGFTDNALLVYTSGTTGLPKAAQLPHQRVFNMGLGFVKCFGIRENDVTYCALPLYHSSGGVCGVGMAMYTGSSLVIRKRFSATHFWNDCREHNVTVIQYIGELCRYLLQTVPHELDATNKVRLAVGNGLRPDIWDQFQTRFNIPAIGEFYGSTEGNAATFNMCESKEAQGAVGRMGPFLRMITGQKLVKFDIENELPVRGKDGFCIECAPGEAGELVSKIDERNPHKRFSGYHGNEKATNSKLMRDVFTKGDTYFRTGDLLRRDDRNYFYFVDRIGDTFRWKGENVSTTQVSEVVSVFPGMSECNVYGVAIPGQDGRACMCSVVLDKKAADFDWKGLYKHCATELPAYAVPRFFRITTDIQATGTFKHQKVQLRKEGCDPTVVKDDIYTCIQQHETYALLDLDLWTSIARGQLSRL